MELTEHFTLFVVDDPTKCSGFYEQYFGFQRTVDMGWYVQLESTGANPYGLAFMAPGHASQSRDHDTVVAGNLFLTFGVADATAERDRLADAGVAVCQQLRDEPWGQRHFIVSDPAGIGIDIVEEIEPDPAFLAGAGV